MESQFDKIKRGPAFFNLALSCSDTIYFYLVDMDQFINNKAITVCKMLFNTFITNK